MKLSGVIEALMAAGGSPEQIVAVVRAAETAQEAEAAERDALLAEKRADAAAKKRMQREAAKLSPGQIGTDRDGEGQSGTDVDIRDSISEPSPLPPGPPNPTPVVIPQSPSGSRPKPKSRSDEFWSAYPKRRGSNPRHLAVEKFDRLVKAGENPETIIAGTKGYARSMRDDDPKFVKQAIGFLNGRMWEDYLGSGQRPVSGGLFASDLNVALDPLVDLPGGLRWPESRVIAKVAEYRANPRSWLEMIGPPPGQPGCRIPQRLIDQVRAA